jgi:hypothetical protein
MCCYSMKGSGWLLAHSACKAEVQLCGALHAVRSNKVPAAAGMACVITS